MEDGQACGEVDASTNQLRHSSLVSSVGRDNTSRSSKDESSDNGSSDDDSGDDDSSDDDSSDDDSSDDDSSDDDSSEGVDRLSPYERKRLNNIKRNEARLKLLGLGSRVQVVNKKPARRKKDAKAKAQNPTRRSGRNIAHAVVCVQSSIYFLPTLVLADSIFPFILFSHLLAGQGFG